MLDHDAMMKAVREAQEKRRQKDFLHLKEGYTFKPDGRSGFVYYREGAQILEIYWEMSGVRQYDVLISLSEIQKWTRPEGASISPEKKQQIITGLKDFLAAKKIRPDFDDRESD
jgi:hypothetical protein